MAKYSSKSIFSPLPVTTRGQNFHINTDPKNEKLLYCSGPAVIVRDLKNPRECYTYTEHSAAPTAACFAPSGYYICSGDMHGKVRVWDTTQETHIIKYEGQVLGGGIKDICWSPDSKRILVAGKGRDSRTHCFMWDSGTSCGSLHGHGKDVNAVAHSPARPFRAVTASEDFHCVFHTGVPYKYEKNILVHKNFVNSVRYSPTGASFCTVSSDKRALLHDGKTGELIGELKGEGGTAHNGGVMAVSYNQAGTQLMTASADKTVKLWDAETQQLVSTFTFGKEVEHQQLGGLWAGDYLLSVAMSGNINYLDPNSSTITRTLKGHQKSIETMEVSGNKIVTASFEGRTTYWDSESGDAEYFTGAGHKNKVIDMKISNDTLISADIEHKVLRTSLLSSVMGDDASTLPSAISHIAAHADTGLEVYTCEKEILLFKNGAQISSKPVSYEPRGCAIAPSGTVLVVGAKEPKLYIYDIEGDTIIQRQELDLTAPLTEISFSPDGAWLGAGSTGRNPLLLNVTNSYKPTIHCWSAQSKLVSCHFSPDSRYMALGGVDSNILVCDTTTPMDSPIKILRAHPLGCISRVRWLNNNTIVSTGSDMQVRQWTINA